MLATAAYLCSVLASGVLPAVLWADVRRAENLARGHYPNMDPGIAIVPAMFLLAPLVMPVLLIELLRLFRGGSPLPISWAVVLGVLTGGPLAYALVGLVPPPPYWVNCVLFCILIAVFYTLRHYLGRRAITPSP